MDPHRFPPEFAVHLADARQIGIPSLRRCRSPGFSVRCFESSSDWNSVLPVHEKPPPILDAFADCDPMIHAGLAQARLSVHGDLEDIRS